MKIKTTSFMALYRLFYSFLLLLIFTSLFTACQTVDLTKKNDDQRFNWAAHQQQVAALNTWRLAGKLLLQEKGTQYLLFLDWERFSPEHFILYIRAQFGISLLTVEQKNQQYLVNITGKKPLVTQDLNTVIQEKSGLDLPYQALEYWVKGIPYPDYAVDARKFNQSGYLTYLQQGKWNIRYHAYMDVTDATAIPGLQLPKHIQVSREEQEITLFIRWL